jgi:hypothetical protein
MHYWRKQKELIKNAKVSVGHFVVRKLENPRILTHPDFSVAKLEEKSTQITRVNMALLCDGQY